jgi:hypothetical protein
MNSEIRPALSEGAAPGGLLHALHAAKMVIAKRVHRADVPATPGFDTESAAYFRSQLGSTRHYLEFGCGASTILASKMVNNLVSVESDPALLAQVRRQLPHDDSPRAVTKLIHANIGWTDRWGMPAFRRPTPRRVRKWERYAKAPWRYFRSLGREPDLILVNGRFRVACILQSLLSLSPASHCQILCDDYVERTHYHAVELFADLTVVGRMAVLRPRRALDRIQVRRLLKEHFADPR